jgi:hypothetical protein
MRTLKLGRPERVRSRSSEMPQVEVRVSESVVNWKESGRRRGAIFLREEGKAGPGAEIWEFGGGGDPREGGAGGVGGGLGDLLHADLGRGGDRRDENHAENEEGE